MQTFTFTLRTECDKCGEMLPINGPLRRATCDSCHARYDLTPARWVDQICSAAEGMRILNSPYKCSDTADRRPQCPRCEEHFALDEALIGEDTTVPCPGCGHPVPTYPAPEWLRAELPMVVQVVGGVREVAADTGAVPVAEDEAASRPVVLSCPNCGGGLKATAASERLIPCAHCGVDVYLPDGVWRRLHPVATVAPWSLVHEGALEPAAEIARRAAERREQERERAEDDRQRQQDEAEEQERLARQRSRDRLVWVILAVVAAVFAGAFLLISSYS
jgi:hypothetical protein